MVGMKGNHLFGQNSPYLAEHAHDPVDWYPWGDEAFAKAKREDKPLFISIGYSTCHWCHVMQHESFQDAAIAELMNKSFICIKVDREERPDVDTTYMKVCQMLTGSGGWPLNVIATPDGKPFFATTYVPKEPRFSMIGMEQLIENINEVWKSDRGHILKNSESIVKALSNEKKKEPAKLDSATFDNALKQMSQIFDFDNGGFGEAPKFPMSLNLLFMLRYHHSTGNRIALSMVERSIECMRMGGIYDQIGGGFHRYATDVMWNAPHFEKMLSDQALLSMAYSEAYLVTHKELYEWTARETYDFVLRELTSKEGAFYTAIDADSDGEEGKFYAFNYNEIYNTLSPAERELFFAVFPIKESDGRKILYMDDSLASIAKDLSIDIGTAKKRLDVSRNKIFGIRMKRKHPNIDNKVLADMNGLMIAALAKGSAAFNDEKYYSAAKKAADFIISKMLDKKGRLQHVYNEGKPIDGYLSDYAFLIIGLVELYQAGFEAKYLGIAILLAKYMQEHFWDKKGGGFFSTSDEAETVLIRDKPVYDNAVPSGNSAALYALLALSRLTGKFELEELAGKLSDSFSGSISKEPSYAPFMLSGLSLALMPSYEVVIASESKSSATKFIEEIRNKYYPNVFLVMKDDEIDELTEFTKQMEPISGKISAYVCTGNVCKSAVAEPGAVIKIIDAQA
jgi:hypothetical protein